jgi:branched-chain amino acid transport system ATP-binding protein
MTNLLEVESLRKSFGALEAVSDLTFQVREKEILGIIGPNGAGKTTAVNLISGTDSVSGGRVLFDGREITGAAPHVLVKQGLTRTFQATLVYGERTVRENALRGAFLHVYPGFWHTFLGTSKAREMREKTEHIVEELLDWLSLTPVADSIASSLPYGYQKTLGMVIALASQPRLVMLDEPAAGLSSEEADHVRDTIKRVRDSGISVVVIDHNMRFISGLCDRILVLHHGTELAQGTPSEVMSNPDVINAYLGKGYAAA